MLGKVEPDTSLSAGPWDKFFFILHIEHSCQTAPASFSMASPDLFGFLKSLQIAIGRGQKRIIRVALDLAKMNFEGIWNAEIVKKGQGTRWRNQGTTC